MYRGNVMKIEMDRVIQLLNSTMISNFVRYEPDGTYDRDDFPSMVDRQEHYINGLIEALRLASGEDEDG